MDTTTLAILVGALCTSINHCSGLESCYGRFYRTSLNYYYGRYYINAFRRYYSYGPQICADKCCALGGYSYSSYKYCCSEYGITPSYKSSSKPSSTTGIIVGSTIGGGLFVGFVTFSLCVFRCMWNDKKRINPVLKETEFNRSTETTVTKGDVPTKESISSGHLSPKLQMSGGNDVIIV